MAIGWLYVKKNTGNLGPRFFPWNVRFIWEFSKFNLSNEIAIRQLKNGTAQQAQNSARFCALPEAQGRAGSACGNTDQGGLLRTRNTRSMCFWLFLRPIYWDTGIPTLQCDRWKWRSKLETNPMVAMVVLLLPFPTLHWGGFQELIDDMSIPWDPKSLEIADTLGKKTNFWQKDDLCLKYDYAQKTIFSSKYCKFVDFWFGWYICIPGFSLSYHFWG